MTALFVFIYLFYFRCCIHCAIILIDLTEITTYSCFEINICPFLDQQTAHTDVAIMGSNMEWGETALKQTFTFNITCLMFHITLYHFHAINDIFWYSSFNNFIFWCGSYTDDYIL